MKGTIIFNTYEQGVFWLRKHKPKSKRGFVLSQIPRDKLARFELRRLK